MESDDVAWYRAEHMVGVELSEVDVACTWANLMVPCVPDMGCHVAPPPLHKSWFVVRGGLTHDL
jgi:hypothetical protein